jgi:hypothetical protein
MTLPPLLEAMGVTEPRRPELPEGWVDRATARLEEVAEEGLTFCADDVRRLAEDDGLPQPPDGRAWGSVIARAKRRGLIVAAGRGLIWSEQRSPRQRAVNLWRAS